MVKSITKGHGFKNKIYKDLLKNTSHVRATIGSGSSMGDADIELYGKYVIEIKHVSKITEAFLKKSFNKVEIESNRLDKEPVLIYKGNYLPIMVMTKYHPRSSIRIRMKYLDWKKLIFGD